MYTVPLAGSSDRTNETLSRSVAQLGRALRSGRRGRKFKSSRSDTKKRSAQRAGLFLCPEALPEWSAEGCLQNGKPRAAWLDADATRATPPSLTACRCASAKRSNSVPTMETPPCIMRLAHTLSVNVDENRHGGLLCRIRGKFLFFRDRERWRAYNSDGALGSAHARCLR